MTGVRAVAAVALSLALHTGVAFALRALGFGLEGPLPTLFVELVEPVVAMSEAPRLERAGPVRPPANRPTTPPAPSVPPRATAPTAAVAVSPSVVTPPPPPPAVLPSPRAATPGPAPIPQPPAASRVSPPPGASPTAPAREALQDPPAASAAMSAPSPEDARREAASGPPSLARGPTASADLGATLRAPSMPAEASAGGGGGSGLGPAASAPDPIARDGASAGAASPAPPTLIALPSGQGGTVPPEYDAYVRALRQRIQERLAYPWLAVRQGLHGTVELELALDPAGRLAAVMVVGREPAGVLREAAIRAVGDATPFPFPPGLAARALTIRLPIVFELR